jgi:hypothetical protein
MHRLNYSKFQNQNPKTNNNTIKELCLASSDGLIIIKNNFVENKKNLELKFNWFDRSSEGEGDNDTFEFIKEASLGKNFTIIKCSLYLYFKLDNFYLLNIHQLSLQYKQ